MSGLWRVLVTGSRTWDDPDLIEHALAVEGRHADREGLVPRLIHGGATGADVMAARVAERLGWVDPEVHPADWRGPCDAGFCQHGPRRVRGNGEDYCPAAGPRRNLRMVQTRPDAVLGFVRARSQGALGCLSMARAEGLHVAAVYEAG
jgi:hypothetical protein